MKVESDEEVSNLLDTITLNLFVPHIIYPTRITSHSYTLIDNIFSNSLNFSDGISGNLTISISDHLAQFLIIDEEFTKISKKQNRLKRDTKNFDQENFILDLLNIDWPDIINIDQNDVNSSFNSFETTINALIEQYMPIKKMSKNEIKQLYKPWITNGIRNSIRRREKLQEVKNEHHHNYKELRNQIVSICRQSKNNYYQKYFADNADNARNTWKGIKTIINVNSSMKSDPTSLIINKKLSSDPMEIATKFNTYFSNIASTLQGKIHHKNQDFNKYLTNQNKYSFFIKPTDKYEVINLINNLSYKKINGPHSVPTKILHLIKFIIADPLSEIINLSFNTGTNFEYLKIFKVKPTYKEKGSNLDCGNYRPISLLSNLNKIIEQIMFSRLYNFLSMHNCIYNLQFGFRRNHSTSHALVSLTKKLGML